MLTQKELKEILNYDPETGIFTWIKIIGFSIKIGKIAGTYNKGYVQLTINRKFYRAHRLAFLYMTGNFPIKFCDHINGQRDDNRWENLRDASYSENAINSKLNIKNSSGHRGITWNKAVMKWQSQAQLNNKYYYLGQYEDINDAIIAYNIFEKENHGEFSRKKQEQIYDNFLINQSNYKNENNPAIYFIKSRGRWRLRPTINGVRVSMGCFLTKEEALNKLNKLESIK